MIMEIIDNKQLEEIIKTNDIVVVEFTSETCGPCRALFKKISMEILAKINQRDDAILVKIDTRKTMQFIKQFGIRGIPTIIFFKNGKQISFKLPDKSGNVCDADRIVGNRRDIDIPKIILEIVEGIR
jgi:thioredoxin-like negative regulator of GroEL